MSSLLKLLPTLLGILSSLLDLVRWNRDNSAAKVAAEAEIANKEAEATREAAVIVSEHVPDSTANDRLRSGDF